MDHQQPFVIEIFKLIFTPLINIIGHILCIPQLLLKPVKLYIFPHYNCSNIFELIYKTIFMGFYLSIYLNFHLIYIFKNIMLVESYLELTLAYLVIYSFTATFYYTKDLKFFIVKDLFIFFVLLINFALYIILFFSFFLRFDKNSRELITNSFNLGLSNNQLLIYNPFLYFFETILFSIFNCMILLHFLNPLAYLRIYPLLQHTFTYGHDQKIFNSFILFLWDFLILVMYVMNIPFIFSFITITFRIIPSLYTTRLYSNFLLSKTTNFKILKNLTEENFKLYNCIFSIVLDSFVENYLSALIFARDKILPLFQFGRIFRIIKFCGRTFFLVIFTLINLIFFWRLGDLVKNHRLYRSTQDIFKFSENFFISVKNGFVDLIFLIVLIFNNLNFLNLRFYNFFARLLEDKSLLINPAYASLSNVKASKGKKSQIPVLGKENFIIPEKTFSLINLVWEVDYLEFFSDKKYFIIRNLHLLIFINLFCDVLISIFSLLNIFSFTFYVKLINYIKNKKNSTKIITEEDSENAKKNNSPKNFLKNFYFFPLFSVQFKENLTIKNSNLLDTLIQKKIREIPSGLDEQGIQSRKEFLLLNVVPKIFAISRIIVIKNIFNDFVYGIFILMNFITLLDPLLGFTHIFNIMKFSCRIKMSFFEGNFENLKISEIIREEILISLNLFREFLFDIFLGIPLIVISIAFFPFNLIKAIFYIVENYYIFYSRKICKLFNFIFTLNYSSENNFSEYKYFIQATKEDTELSYTKKVDFIKNLFKQFLNGWILLLKFVILNLSIFRGLLLYIDIFRLKKYYNLFLEFSGKISKTQEFLGYLNYLHKDTEISDNAKMQDLPLLDEENKNKKAGKSFLSLFDNPEKINLLRNLFFLNKIYSKNFIFIFYDKKSWLKFYNSEKFYAKKLTTENTPISSDLSLTREIKQINQMDVNNLKNSIAKNINIFYFISNIIEDNFDNLIKEILFLPFIIFAYTTNPLILFGSYISNKNPDYDFFRQRIFYYKYLITLGVIKEYIRCLINLLKILMIVLTIIKLHILFKICYYHFRDLISKDIFNNYKNKLEEEFEGEFSKDLNKILLESLNFYFMIVLFILNIILILRIIPVIRRTYRFISRYASNVKYTLFSGKKTFTNSNSFESTKISSFVSIVEFLNPKDIGRIMVLNKTFNKKVEKKLVWENLFVNYYLQEIKDFLKYSELIEKRNKFSEENLSEENPNLHKKLNSYEENILENYENKNFSQKKYDLQNLKNIYNDYNSKLYDYRILCQKTQNIFDLDLELSEYKRDCFIGLTNVLLEETFESIFKFPHLILIPFKILSIPIIYLSDVIFYCYLYIFDYQNINTVYKPIFKEVEYMIDQNYFYNMQLAGIFAFLKILSVFFISFFLTLDFIYVSFLKFFSLQFLLGKNKKICYNKNPSYSEIFIEEKIPPSENYEIIRSVYKPHEVFVIFWQYLFSFIILLLHVGIVFLPVIYFKKEGIQNIFHEVFYDDHRLENHKLMKAGKTTYFLVGNWVILIETFLRVFWNMPMIEKFYIVFGKYFLNVISLFASGNLFILYGYLIKDSIKDIIVYQILEVWLWCLFSHIFSFNMIFNIIYPHIFLFSVYNFFARKLGLLHNKYILNLVVTIVILFPFYLNFRVKLSLFRFIMINIWGITSYLKFTKTYKNIGNGEKEDWE